MDAVNLSKEIVDAVKRLKAKNDLLAQTRTKLVSLNQSIKKIHENQERLRANIKSLEKVSAGKLLDRYLKGLENDEDELLKI